MILIFVQNNICSKYLFSNILTIIASLFRSLILVNLSINNVQVFSQLINPFKKPNRPNQCYHSIVFRIVDNSIATRRSFLSCKKWLIMINVFINLPAYFKTWYNYYIIMNCKPKFLFYILYFYSLQNFNFPKNCIFLISI